MVGGGGALPVGLLLDPAPGVAPQQIFPEVKIL